MNTINEKLTSLKQLIVKALKGETEALDRIGLALGGYLLRYMKKLLHEHLEISALIVLSGLLLGSYSSILPLLTAEIPAAIMLITCTLYLTHAPRHFFGKK